MFRDGYYSDLFKVYVVCQLSVCQLSVGYALKITADFRLFFPPAYMITCSDGLHLFIHSFIHSLIHSFIHSFKCSLGLLAMLPLRHLCIRFWPLNLKGFFMQTRPHTRPISSRWRVGRGSDAVRQGQGGGCNRDGLRNHFFSRFCNLHHLKLRVTDGPTYLPRDIPSDRFA